MKVRPIYFLFLLIPFWVLTDIHAQQSFSGIIIDRYDKAPISNVIIRNMRTNELVFSNNMGGFTIKAKDEDSILFVSQSYYPFQMMYLSNRKKDQPIVLERKLFSILEVEIRPDWTAYQKDSIERREIYQGTLDEEKTTSVLSPVTTIANRISRKARKKWQFQENYKKWEQEKFTEARYSEELVASLTKLEGDSLAFFMNAYPIPYDYARIASDMEIKMWILNNFREWEKKSKENPVKE